MSLQPNRHDSNDNAELLRSKRAGNATEHCFEEGIVSSNNEEHRKMEFHPESFQNSDDTEEGAKERWELCRRIPPEQEIECGHEACKNIAIKIWISVVSRTEFPLCQDCENVKLAALGDEGQTNDQPSTKHDIEIPSTPKDRKQADGSPGKEMFDSYATHTKEEVRNLPVVDCTPTKEDTDQTEGETFALVDFVTLEKLKAGGRACDICIQNNQEEDLPIQPMPACTIWQSTQDPNSKKWFYCIDCLVDDYGSFPDYEELRQHNALQNINPATYHEHLELMKTKCSRKRNPNLPNLPASFSCKPSLSLTDNENATVVTPLHNPAQSGTTASGASLQLSDDSSRSAIPIKVTPKALAVHKKWQEQAETMGGKGAKIIVSAVKAKKIIYLALRDEFRPMNITDIYKVRKHMMGLVAAGNLFSNVQLFWSIFWKLLKATIPQPVLSSSLKNMADQNRTNTFDDDSDEDQTPLQEGPGDDENDFYGSRTLIFKAGRNPQSSLYYFSYKKLKAMDNEELQTLFSARAIAIAETDKLKLSIEEAQTKTTSLLSEPTNVELIALLQNAEDDVAALKEQVDDSRKLQVHTGTRIDRQKKIQKMCAHWSKRKRMCLSFLSALEENTNGAVTIQKSLAGDGPLQLDSDEAVIKGEILLVKQRARKRKLGINSFPVTLKRAKTEPSLSSTVSSDLVAVRLGKGGKVERVYLREEEEGKRDTERRTVSSV
jgi:hypothetical protein